MNDRAALQAETLQREAEARPRARSLQPLRALLPFLRRYPGMIAAAFAALVVAAGATLAVPAAVREMIDHGFSRDNAGFIDRYFVLLIGVAAVLGAATAVRFFFVTWIGERVVADLRRAVFGHLLSLSPAFFEVTRTGEVLSRLTADTTLIQTVVGSSISIALRNVVLLIGGIGLLVMTSPALSGLTLVLLPAIVLPLIIFGRSVRRLSRASQDRIADTSAHAGETLNAIPTVQAFTHEDADRAHYGRAVESAFATAVQRVKARAAMTALVIFLVFAGVVGVMWVGARLVLSGDMTGGELGQFILYAVLTAGAIGALSEVWGELQAAAGASERLNEILMAQPAIVAPANPSRFPTPAQGAVAFEGVRFSYPTRPDARALAGVTFDVRPGETVALVGPSGAGKTTVFQLLLRFYDPQSGRVLLDGVDVKSAEPRDLRARIAIVPQETVIFAGTVADNIRFGNEGADMDAVRRAAQTAQAAEFIDRLPNGYETLLGERGVTLSGGQRQRIAIARAVLRDAPLLLLDEATSALDAESERLVQIGLQALMKQRTTLVIAHRLATVQKADRIIVLDQGRIVAEGAHAQLIADDGLYAKLARLQFAQGAEALSAAQ